MNLDEAFPFKRVLVTGGTGFLGRFIVERLRSLSGLEIFVPRRSAYDLVLASDIERLLGPPRVEVRQLLSAASAQTKKNRESFFTKT